MNRTRYWAHTPNEDAPDRGQAYPACRRGSSAVAVSSPLHGDPDDDPTLRLLRQAFSPCPQVPDRFTVPDCQRARSASGSGPKLQSDPDYRDKARRPAGMGTAQSGTTGAATARHSQTTQRNRSSGCATPVRGIGDRRRSCKDGRVRPGRPLWRPSNMASHSACAKLVFLRALPNGSP